jgi:hypothetical protein
MFQDVDQASERIADIEAPHVPRLGYWAVLDLEPCLLHPAVNIRQVVYLDRDVGHGGVPDPPSVSVVMLAGLNIQERVAFARLSVRYVIWSGDQSSRQKTRSGSRAFIAIGPHSSWAVMPLLTS